MNTDHQSNSPYCPDLSERPVVAAIPRPARQAGDDYGDRKRDAHPPRLVVGQILGRVEMFGSAGSLGPPQTERSDGSQRVGLTESALPATRSMNVELVVDDSVSSADLLLSAYLFAGPDDGVVVVGDDARSAAAGQDFVHESLWAVLGEAAARWDSTRPAYAPPA